jgi:hypothetical protein
MRKRLIVAGVAVAISEVCGVSTGMSGPFECRDFSEIAGNALERPEKPSCVESILDEVTFDSCREEMETYRSKISDYMRCLAAESKDALSEYNAAVSEFNCKARGPC